MMSMQTQFSNVLRYLLVFSKNPNRMKCLVASDSWCQRACQHLQMLRYPWNWVIHSLPYITFLGFVGNLWGTGSGKICLSKSWLTFCLPCSPRLLEHVFPLPCRFSQVQPGGQSLLGPLCSTNPSRFLSSSAFIVPLLLRAWIYSMHRCPIKAGFVRMPEEEVRSGWFFPSF